MILSVLVIFSVWSVCYCIYVNTIRVPFHCLCEINWTELESTSSRCCLILENINSPIFIKLWCHRSASKWSWLFLVTCRGLSELSMVSYMYFARLPWRCHEVEENYSDALIRQHYLSILKLCRQHLWLDTQKGHCKVVFRLFYSH